MDYAPVYEDKRPPPKNLYHHLSRATAALDESPLMGIFKHFSTPGMAQLAGDLPNADYFVFDTLEAKIATTDRWKPTPNHSLLERATAEQKVPDTSNIKDKQKSFHKQDSVVVPHQSNQTNGRRRVDVASALGFGTVQGLPPFYWIFHGFVQKHMQPNCPYKDGPEFLLTCGSRDGWSKVLLALTNEWSDALPIRERDALLVEKFCNTQALQGVRPRGVNIVPVEIDGEGMMVEGPGGLRDVLENWDYEESRRPRLMYTSTMGHNPTSGVLSFKRRRDIYALCCTFDIIICEDDPYWYLQYPSATAPEITAFARPALDPRHIFHNGERKPKGWKSHGYEFLDSLLPSSSEIDPDGRVIRLETFSHIIAPNCKLGWIAAQGRPFIERIARITETTTSQPSGLAQALMAEILLGPDPVDKDAHKAATLPKDGWRADGWIRWLEGLRGEYERRMNIMCRTLDAGKYIVSERQRSKAGAEGWNVVEKTQIMSFDWPRGGKFVWLQVHFEEHPLYSVYGEEPHQLSTALWKFLISDPYLVLTYPGATFSATQEIGRKEGYKYFRLCFGSVDEAEVEPSSQKFVQGVAAFWRVEDRKAIERLLEESVIGVTSAHVKQLGGSL